MAKLLVNADDFGLHSSVNEAIKKCVLAGSVNSISVIANGTEADFNWLKEVKNKAFVGAHLTWVGEPWLTTSYIFSDWKALMAKVMTGGNDFRKKMEEEAHAQIRLLLNQGIQLSHIDSHQHVHIFPMIWQIVEKMQQQYNVNDIRVPKVAGISSLRRGVPGAVLNMLASRKHIPGIHFYCAGIRHAGNYDLALLRHELKKYAGKDTMLIMHPGTSNQPLNKKYGQWHFDWEKEYHALINDDFLSVLKENHFELIQPKR